MAVAAPEFGVGLFCSSVVKREFCSVQGMGLLYSCLSIERGAQCFVNQSIRRANDSMQC